MASALDLAGWFDSELEVRQSHRSGWQDRDVASLLAAWQHARRTSRREVTTHAAVLLGVQLPIRRGEGKTALGPPFRRVRPIVTADPGRHSRPTVRGGSGPS